MNQQKKLLRPPEQYDREIMNQLECLLTTTLLPAILIKGSCCRERGGSACVKRKIRKELSKRVKVSWITKPVRKGAYYSVLFAICLNLGLIGCDLQNGHKNIPVKNTFCAKSYATRGIVLDFKSQIERLID